MFPAMKRSIKPQVPLTSWTEGRKWLRVKPSVTYRIINTIRSFTGVFHVSSIAASGTAFVAI